MFDKKLHLNGGLRLPSLDHAQPRHPLAPGRDGPPSQLLDCRTNGSPWDDQTILFLSENPRLVIHVSYIERRFQSGAQAAGAAPTASFSISATGFLDCPFQHVHAQIDFSDRIEDYGVAFLTRTARQAFGEEPVSVPFLRVFLQSKDHIAQSGLVEAHRDALRSGLPTSDFAVFHDAVPAEWFQVQSDTVYGKLPIIGSAGWSDLGSSDVERWALPIEHERFSLNDYPEPYRLRRTRD